MIHKENPRLDSYGLLFQPGVTESRKYPKRRYVDLKSVKEYLDDETIKKLVTFTKYLQNKYPGIKYYISLHDEGRQPLYYAVDAVKGENFLFMEIKGRGDLYSARPSVLSQQNLHSLIKKLFPEKKCWRNTRWTYRNDKPVLKKYLGTI